jgi:hypothetical protein
LEYRSAQARYSNAATALHRIELSESSQKRDARAEMQLRNSVPVGLYEHFKSSKDNQKFYTVLGVIPGVSAEHRPVVEYFALYAPHAGERVNRVLLGHIDAFLYPIKRDSDPKEPFMGARFKLAVNLTWDQATRLHNYAKRLSRCKDRLAFLSAFTKAIADSR